MKKLLLVVALLIPKLGFCDSTISAMPVTTTLGASDILPVVTNPGSSPQNFSITKTNLQSTLGITTLQSNFPVSLSTAVTGVLPIANGGTGTSSPGLVAGTNVTITGSWPNNTINASGGGSGSGVVNSASQYEGAYYSVAGSSNVVSGYANFDLYPSSVVIATATYITGISTMAFGTNTALDISSGTLNIGDLLIAGSAGTLNQVVASQGAGFPAKWVAQSGGVPSVQSSGNAAITGAVTLQQGTNVTLSQSGSTITITSSGGGSSNLAITTVTVSYVAVSTDSVILADATGGSLTVTLPTATGIKGQQYTVKRQNSGANTVTVATTSAQTIDGSTTQILFSPFTSIDIISDGSNWEIL